MGQFREVAALDGVANLDFSLLYACAPRSQLNSSLRLKVYLQAQGKKTGHNVTDTCIITVMKDGANLQSGFFLSEGALHTPETLVGRGHFRGGQIGIGP